MANVAGDDGWNILKHMKFGVFENLEELNACFLDVSSDSIQEMNQITPNLKKLEIRYASLDTIHALLETLDNLETVAIQHCSWDWEITDQQQFICPNLKHLSCASGYKLSAESITRLFLNLESYQNGNFRTQVTEPFFDTLLGGLKQLKTLNLKARNFAVLEPDVVLQSFLKHGRNLEDVEVVLWSNDLMIVPHFVIEKRPGGSFGVKILDSMY